MSETLGARIRQARARLRLSQAALARQIGISATSMNAIESGETDPRASRITRLSEVLGVSTDYLLGRTDDPSPRRKRLLLHDLEDEDEETSQAAPVG